MTKEPEEIEGVLITDVLLQDGWHAVSEGSDQLAAFWTFGADRAAVHPFSTAAVSHEFIERVTDRLYSVKAIHLFAIRGEVAKREIAK